MIDADGLQALPGLVDLHTHLREPGFEQSETVLTGSRAAAAGGFTAVHAMANTCPVQDTAGRRRAGRLARRRSRLRRRCGRSAPSRSGSRGSGSSELGAMAAVARRACGSSATTATACTTPLLMRRALEYVKTFDGVIAQHAQEPRLTEGAQMNEGAVERRARARRLARRRRGGDHRARRAAGRGTSARGCTSATSRPPGSVDIIRWAKARGIRVTAEVTPHHLLLTDELARGYDARFKVNPPLRRDEDVHALRAALADGTIDIVATDHAPHPLESKECAWQAASFGMVGLESALQRRAAGGGG